MKHAFYSRKADNDLSKALWMLLPVFVVICYPAAVAAEAANNWFTLKSSIDHALENNIEMRSAQEEVGAADAVKKRQFTEFLPKATVNYAYSRLDEEKTAFGGFVTRPRDGYEFRASVDQPVFTGFALLTQYKMSGLNLDIAGLAEQRTRRDLIFQVKQAYFELLQSQKLENVARQEVRNLKAQAEVARNFFDVGMIPKNDLLESEVALANAEQNLVVKQNEVVLAKSRFNTLLRRPVDADVEIEDVLGYEPFTETYEDCVQTALKERVEIELSDKEVMVSQKDVNLAQGDYYPTIGLQGNYYKRGDNPGLGGDPGAFSHRSEWDIIAAATWTFWEWGKTSHDVNEKKRRLSQAELKRMRVEDDIRQELKRAYVVLKAAEKNISTAEKAVEQAQENFRMNEERFKEQVATSTDVLDAQTLLTETETRYFNTLSAYNLAKAGLHKAMGVEIISEP